MNDLIFQLLTPRSLSARDDGELVLGLWKAHLPSLLPDYFGNWEPITERFNPDNMEAALEAWRWPFLAVKKRPAMESDIWMRKGTQPVHAIWVLRADIKGAEQHGLLNLLREAATTLEADFACVHLLTPSEVERGRRNETVLPLNKEGSKYTFMIGSDQLQRGIPELYWATVFGEPYLDMFGRDCVLSTPVFSAESLGNNAVLLQLSPDLRDLGNRSTELEQIRSAAKKHLGMDAFFQANAERSIGYRVPHFALGGEMATET